MTQTSLMTLALSTWNHERYVEQALRAAFAQDYSPLEIIVSDDASTDGTYAIVERLVADYRGPHIVRLNRNERNLGVGAHSDLLMQMALGEMVVLSAGDDIDESDRVSVVARAWLAGNGATMAVAGPMPTIDEHGVTTGNVIRLEVAQPVTAEGLAQAGCAVGGGAFARRLHAVFGPMGTQVVTAEDIVLGFRAALVGTLTILDRAVMKYRQHGASLLGSSGPLAPEAQQYRRGFERMLRGMMAARTIQLADIARAQALGLISAGRADGLAESIRRHLSAEGLSLELLQRKLRPAMALLWQACRGRHSLKAVVKALMAGYAPSWWFGYTRWRHRRARGELHG